MGRKEVGDWVGLGWRVICYVCTSDLFADFLMVLMIAVLARVGDEDFMYKMNGDIGMPKPRSRLNNERWELNRTVYIGKKKDRRL